MKPLLRSIVAASLIATTVAQAQTTLTIDSKILQEPRRILIGLPPSFTASAPDRRYPVTVVFDGDEAFAPMMAVSTELSKNGLIPEEIIVAIPNTRRLRDLTPPGLSVSGSSLNEGGDRFLDFIERELLPEIDRRYRGGLPRSLVGHSSGGILATYAAATRTTFRNVVALDTPTGLGSNWLAAKLTTAARSASAPLHYASIEAVYAWTDSTWNALTAAAPRDWQLYRESARPLESHESIPFIGMYLGLRKVWADYSMLAAPVMPTTSILRYYNTLGAAWATTVVPPKKLLTQVLDDLVGEGRGAEARQAYTQLVKGYGAPANDSRLIKEVEDAERQPPPKESVETLLATPFPTAAQATPLVGEWVGDVRMGLDAPRTNNTRLVIRVVNGLVTGETIHDGIPEPMRTQKWEYFTITPAGFTFGYMNGMRPRGVLLFEGTLKGDVLSGEMRFGGVNVRGPDGEAPPRLFFEFKRVR